jgi:protein-S-isoprenylcysteine O-methyltransferase Ste14
MQWQSGQILRFAQDKLRAMPMPVFIAVCAFWILSEIVIMIRWRSRAQQADRRDRLSLYVLWSTFVFGPFIGGLLSGLPATQMSPSIQPYAFWGGLTLLLTGIAVRWIAIATLKRYFTVDVAIARDHKVIQSGLYGVVRHPSYAGSLLSSIGLGLAFMNWASFAAIVLLSILGLSYRIAVEEKALIDALGDEYREYARRTKRLIPGVF